MERKVFPLYPYKNDRLEQKETMVFVTGVHHPPRLYSTLIKPFFLNQCLPHKFGFCFILFGYSVDDSIGTVWDSVSPGRPWLGSQLSVAGCPLESETVRVSQQLPRAFLQQCYFILLMHQPLEMLA